MIRPLNRSLEGSGVVRQCCREKAEVNDGAGRFIHTSTTSATAGESGVPAITIAPGVITAGRVPRPMGVRSTNRPLPGSRR